MKSHLGKFQARQETTEDEIFLLRKKTFHTQGIVMIPLDEIDDDWFLQAVLNWAQERYGKKRT